MDLSHQLIIKDSQGVCPVKEDTISLAKIASKLPKGKVLDMGTGTGFIGIYLNKKGFIIDSVDINRKALDLAKENSKINGTSINIFYSALFSNINSKYDLIVFNLPINPQEGNLFRFIGRFVRKFNFFEKIALKVVFSLKGNKRLNLIKDFLETGKNKLNSKGLFLLNLKNEESDSIQKDDRFKIKKLLQLKSTPDFSIVCIKIK